MNFNKKGNFEIYGRTSNIAPYIKISVNIFIMPS